MATTIWMELMIPWCLQRCWSLGGSGSWTDTAGGPHPCWSKSVPTAPGCTPSGWYICTERGRETVKKLYLCISYSITMFWFILQTDSIIIIFGCFLHILHVMVSLCWNVKKPTSRCYSNNTVVLGSLHRELGSRWKLGVMFRFFHQHICAISECDHLLYGNCLSKARAGNRDSVRCWTTTLVCDYRVNILSFAGRVRTFVFSFHFRTWRILTAGFHGPLPTDLWGALVS